MFQPATRLLPPDTGDGFQFPFATPYSIQLDLMRSLYSTVENRQVGIFESPTGTGKSLTLTCGVLSWLRDYEEVVGRELVEKIEWLKGEVVRLERETAGAVDWISGQFETMGIRKELGELKGVKDLMDEYGKRLEELKVKSMKVKKRKFANKVKKDKEENGLETENQVALGEDDYLVEDSDEEDESNLETEDNPQKYHPVQVIFCSRTHSQLGQVVEEVRRTEFGKQIRLTTIASRQNFCINPEVRRLRSNPLINERCLELQKKSGKATVVDEDQNARKKRKVSGGDLSN